jgi:hypothetical protein
VVFFSVLAERCILAQAYDHHEFGEPAVFSNDVGKYEKVKKIKGNGRVQQIIKTVQGVIFNIVCDIAHCIFFHDRR